MPIEKSAIAIPSTQSLSIVPISNFVKSTVDRNARASGGTTVWPQRQTTTASALQCSRARRSAADRLVRLDHAPLGGIEDVPGNGFECYETRVRGDHW